MALSICKLSSSIRTVCSTPKRNAIVRVASRDTMAPSDARTDEQFEIKASKQRNLKPSQKSEGAPLRRRSLSVEGLVEFDAPANAALEPAQASLCEDKQWEEKIDHSLTLLHPRDTALVSSDRIPVGRQTAQRRRRPPISANERSPRNSDRALYRLSETETDTGTERAAGSKAERDPDPPRHD
eukprot:gene9039-16161_t